MWYNRFTLGLLRSPLHGLVSGNMMAIRYTGRKSGASITVPVNYVRDGDSLWTISFRHRTWWKNLRGGAPVSLLLKGREIPAQGVVLESPDEVEAALPRYLALAPAVARALKIPMQGGSPAPADLHTAAERIVLVRFSLQEPDRR